MTVLIMILIIVSKLEFMIGSVNESIVLLIVLILV